MSFRLSPFRTETPLRVRVKDCLPVPMGMEKALGPAEAGKDWLLLPEVIVIVPGEVRRATTKTESATVE